MVLNYFIGVSARWVDNPAKQDNNRYFLGYLTCDKHCEHYDMKVVEKRELLNSHLLAKSTIDNYSVMTFAKKDHIKAFKRRSVEGFNRNRKSPLDKYYTFEMMMKGLLIAEVEKLGLSPHKIDLKNVNIFIGGVKQNEK